MSTHVHLHMHSCNTPCNVCKHVHLVQMTTTNTACKDSSKHVNSTTLQYLSDLFENTNSTHSELSGLRLQVQHQINELNTLVQKRQHVDALKASTQHLSSAIIVIKAIENNSNSRSHILPQKRYFPPNINANKQLHFFSTKKRKLISTHLNYVNHTCLA